MGSRIYAVFCRIDVRFSMWHFMSMQSAGPERRAYPRISLILDIEVQELPLLISQPPPPRTVLGRLQNLSRGGLSFLTNESLDGASMVMCQIVVPELPVPIPVLANVRWGEQLIDGGYGQLYGLQFLFNPSGARRLREGSGREWLSEYSKVQ